MNVLEVQDLGKAYSTYGSELRRISSWFGFSAGKVNSHWVLRNVNFALEAGESLAIIGQNGAGKSTLLKLIVGIQKPSEGSIVVNGRIAAILELGLGFNPELTGFQNAVHGLGLWGYSSEQIREAMPAVKAFSEIGEYFDEPIRTYSSGMQVRLAFSVATVFRPDILIVDEALAVGDVFFQQKCFDRIKAFRLQGTTLLFVTHAIESVYSLCDRALLIETGRVVLDGKPKVVIDTYNASQITRSRHPFHAPKITDNSSETPLPTPEMTPLELASFEMPGNANKVPAHLAEAGSYFTVGVDIGRVGIYLDDVEVGSFVSESEVTIRVGVEFSRFYLDPHVGFQLRGSRGEVLFMTNTYAMKKHIGPVQPGMFVEVDFSFAAALTEGQYTVTVGVANEGVLESQFKESLARSQNACAFTVLRNFNSISWSGVCNLFPSCKFRYGSTVAGK